ncbi:hypothetical protein ACFYY8_19365 [Streptosporangium sp. NPDC001559]|uniref:hypothetical protein n=1 Tax=Streptosporangium sp. NPDC001559 TaxID=3366187 RepID=UPI0036EA7E37
MNHYRPGREPHHSPREPDGPAKDQPRTAGPDGYLRPLWEPADASRSRARKRLKRLHRAGALGGHDDEAYRRARGEEGHLPGPGCAEDAGMG